MKSVVTPVRPLTSNLVASSSNPMSLGTTSIGPRMDYGVTGLTGFTGHRSDLFDSSRSKRKHDFIKNPSCLKRESKYTTSGKYSSLIPGSIYMT